MPAGLRILVVCTANICRSPATATLMRRQLTPHLGDAPLVVESAGIAAQAGSPACDLASALIGEYVARHYAGQSTPVTPPGPARHAARRVTADLVAQADLVLALDRSHRGELARLAPSARPRIFTLRQAARLAEGVATAFAAGALPPGAPPLPPRADDRFRWLVAELDAARGSAKAPPDGPAAGPQHGTGAWEWHADDVPDPHVYGYQLHPMAITSLEDAVTQLCEVIVTVGVSLVAGAPVTSV